MSAFTAGIAVLFTDPNISAPALYRVGGEEPAVPVRIILQAPDAVADFSGVRHVQQTSTVDVRISEVGAPSKGDTYEIGGTLYRATGAPRRDSQGLVWQIETVPV